MIPNIEQTAMRKVYLRLLPFSVLCMFVCYLDRVNVGFAALTMNKDLGLSAYFFGLGAGAFYGGYCLFEVPSNLVLERVGARFWIARIMITWGLLAGAMAFVSGPVSFVTLRFLLGAAEAGFFPGILFYFHYWFPMRHRGRMISWFTVATPISVALGGPISTGLLGLDGSLWPRRLAVGVHRRGNSGRDPRLCRADLFARPARPRILADPGGEGMAGGGIGPGTARDRSPSGPTPCFSR